MAIKRKNDPALVTAVIPAYNEEDRISSVLEALCQAEIIKEIIVVDDGSTDGTKEVVARFKPVKYLRNRMNMGKGFSLGKGVEESEGNVIFFCDADLDGLGPEIVEEIVNPVLYEGFDMFVGAREYKENLFTKAFVFLESKWGIYPTTGQRALRKEIWEKLPECFKRNYQAEVGLNYFVRRYGRGFGFKKFFYGHIKKERKFGILKGLYIKFNMYADVISASLRFRLLDRKARPLLTHRNGERKPARYPRESDAARFSPDGRNPKDHERIP